MSGALLESVERHTRLAGHNRVAMLLFRLGEPQLFGINVFKVREVLRRPPLERMPGAHPLIAGTCDYRGQTIPVIDMAAALGYAPLKDEPSAHLLVTEFSRSMQGFLVADLLHMVHCAGETLVTPEPALGFGTKVNAITRVDGALVAVVDVEHVLASIHGVPGELSPHMLRAVDGHAMSPRRVLVVDDSIVARRQVEGVFKQMNIECVLAEDGVRALAKLHELIDADPSERINLVVSDIEMPQMDGYALTRAIREEPALRQLKVVLHSSISGIFNEAMVREVHADRFIAKFQPDQLAQAVLDLLPG
ncbi:chemotaxis signal transduction protein [Dyella thiooxydans]|uniref:Chemotaxis signal transduction protein n=1 Tax=Dyella thiooxydans TaxID=445710 RepID=A0A161JC58_9GAMM|nr:chemotaxis protein [Dyella thiooxydans]AND67549.1 chemotaxis signal transduction protein [Dyella thiooxydans]